MAPRTRSMTFDEVQQRRRDAKSYRSTSEDHLEAKKLLDRATSPQSAPGAHVKKLIDEKSAFQYSSTRVTQPRARKTITALERLVAHMEATLAT